MIFGSNKQTLIIINPETNIKVEVDITKYNNTNDCNVHHELTKVMKMAFPTVSNVYDVQSFGDDSFYISSVTNDNVDDVCILYHDITKMKRPNTQTLHIWTRD